MGISVFPAPAAGGKTVKGQVFTSSGNWTAPTGVNFVTVYAVSGGGGAGEGRSNQNVGGTANTGGNGGSTTFGSTLLVAVGASGDRGCSATNFGEAGVSGLANSGNGGGMPQTNQTTSGPLGRGKDAIPKVGTVAVTPGTSYGIAIGAGGTGGAAGDGSSMVGGSGGSGWLSLEWEE